MKLLRTVGQQILLSFIVLSAVFAAGFLAGSSSGTSAAQAECLQLGGKWSNGICTVAETSK